MSDACRVDFYVLAEKARPADKLACQLALKAWVHGHRVLVRTGDSQDVQALDELMWNLPAGRFLPHESGPEAPGPAVAIDSQDSEIGADRDLIVNLAASAVPDPTRFRRLLEIVPAEDGLREASRQKFRTYRDQGLHPEHLNIT